MNAEIRAENASVSVTDCWFTDDTKETTPEQRIAELELLVAQLREELWEQWESNHFEHCGRDWPHPEGKMCHWPLPNVIAQVTT